ncbi:MAG TPA: glycerophosphoryl diester phosphodiesterase membrane domain-containing protein [Coleofasciculaceae cyanobacterium]
MDSNSNPQGSVQPLLQPLSVGNAVSAGLRLYSSHFQQYITVALVATLWILLPLVLAGVIILLFTTTQNYYGLLALIIPAWIALLLYCIARYMADSAAIARLAFGELTQQPETSQQARRFTRSRMWWFWLVALLMSLIYGGIAVIFYILLVVLVVFTVGAMGGLALFQSGTPEVVVEQIFTNPSFVITFGLGFLALLLIFITLFSWFGARFAVAEIPLAIEAEGDATQSIGRSWQLTQKSAWRVFLILFITGLITIPLQFLVQMVNGAVGAVLAALMPPETPSTVLLSTVVNYILSFTISILILPLWQTIKAVIYYDLRSRREGLGLQLRNPIDR